MIAVLLSFANILYKLNLLLQKKNNSVIMLKNHHMEISHDYQFQFCTVLLLLLLLFYYKKVIVFCAARNIVSILCLPAAQNQICAAVLF